MKKFITFVVILGVLLVMMLTCPKAEDHKEAITTAYRESVKKNTIIPDFLVKDLLKGWVNNTISVKDFVLISIGTYSMNDENQIVSIGAFNHVFTFTKDDLIEEAGRSLGLDK
jgi:hypothetical protein